MGDDSNVNEPPVRRITQSPASAPIPTASSGHPGQPLPAPATSIPVSPSGAPSARTVGMAAYGVGIVLNTLTFFWALNASNEGQLQPQPTNTLGATSLLTPWALQEVLHLLLPALVMTFAGWLIAGRGAQLFSAGCASRSDPVGKVLGLGVFCGGIGLIMVVFSMAAHSLGTPVPTPGPQQDYLTWGLNSLFEILLLTVLALDGSLITGRGVQLFLGSFAREETAVA